MGGAVGGAIGAVGGPAAAKRLVSRRAAGTQRPEPLVDRQPLESAPRTKEQVLGRLQLDAQMGALG